MFVWIVKLVKISADFARVINDIAEMIEKRRWLQVISKRPLHSLGDQRLDLWTFHTARIPGYVKHEPT